MDPHTQHFRYSLERLETVDAYCQRASKGRVLLVLLATPLPMLAAILALESLPRQDPHDGWRGNWTFYGRSFIGVCAISVGVTIQLAHELPERHTSFKSFVWIAFLQAIAFCGTLLLVAAASGYFPVPFSTLLGAMPMGMAGDLASWCLFRHVPENPVRKKIAFALLALSNLLIFIYPMYSAAFANIGTMAQAPFSALLIVISWQMCRQVAAQCRLIHDMAPEVIVFSVDLFSALYTSSCMQNAGSLATTAVIIAMDALHAVHTVHAIQRLVTDARGAQAKAQLSHLPLLQAAVQAYRQDTTLLRRGPVRLRSCNTGLGRRVSVLRGCELETTRHPCVVEESVSSAVVQRSGYVLSGNVTPVIPTPDANLASTIPNIETNASLFLASVTKAMSRTEYVILCEYVEAFVPIIYSKLWPFPLLSHGV